MVKATISRKRRKFLRSTPRIKSKKELRIREDAILLDCNPTNDLLDEERIARAIWECLKNNDPEGVIEIIEIHLEIVNKTKQAQNVDLPKSTMYNAFKGKNPTIKTLAKLVNCCSSHEEKC